MAPFNAQNSISKDAHGAEMSRVRIFHFLKDLIKIQSNRPILHYDFNKHINALSSNIKHNEIAKSEEITQQTYILTTSPSSNTTSLSLRRGEKWQTQLLTDMHVGNAIPAERCEIKDQ